MTRQHRRLPRILATTLMALLVLSAPSATVSAHQPWFEETDITAAAPWQIADPSVSLALYASLDPTNDVDYFTFDGVEGEVVLVGLSIPAIEGQSLFAPEIALLGPGFATADLPAQIVTTEGDGVYQLAAVTGETTLFSEPFSRTDYWERQEERIALPANSRYTIVVWHAEGERGRYTLAVGDQEIPGGDRAFRSRLPGYWTPLPPPAAPLAEQSAPSAPRFPHGQDADSVAGPRPGCRR